MSAQAQRALWFRRILSHVIVIGVVLLAAAALAHAQGPNSVNGPSSILDEYKSLQNGWIAKLLGAAQRLFFLLAGIEVAWSFTLLAIEKADFQALTSTIVRKIMWIGIFYAILLYGVTPGGGGWIPAIIDSFHILGQNASSVGPLGPERDRWVWREYVNRPTCLSKGCGFPDEFCDAAWHSFFAPSLFSLRISP